MKITVEMPWEKRCLTVNHMRFGKAGGYRKKPKTQAWMGKLAADVNEAAQGEGLKYKIRVVRDKLRYELLSPELVKLPLKATVDFRYPDKRRRDDHNFYKVICDAVAAGLGIDDKDIRISTGTVEVDRENPGFTITVEDEG